MKNINSCRLKNFNPYGCSRLIPSNAGCPHHPAGHIIVTCCCCCCCCYLEFSNIFFFNFVFAPMDKMSVAFPSNKITELKPYFTMCTFLFIFQIKPKKAEEKTISHEWTCTLDIKCATSKICNLCILYMNVLLPCGTDVC